MVAIDTISPEVKEAILEKWLTYCKSMALTEFCRWRQQLMCYRLNHERKQQLKILLEHERNEAEKKIKYFEDREETKLNKNVDSYGPRINKIFPLLDPDIEQEERIKRN